jgi:6-phosphogluconolactonase (cycloisomerase 2 family)
VLITIFTGCGGDDNGGGTTNNTPAPSSTANQFGYVINAGTNEIRAMTVDGTTGNLALVTGSSPIATGTLPHDVQVDRQGRYVYVANHESSFVSGWRINTDGSLTPINPSTAGSPVTNLSGINPTEDRPHSSVMDKDGQHLYVAAGIGPATLKVYQIQTAPGPTQGTLTAMTGQSFTVGVHAHRVRMSPNGQFLYVAAEDSGEVYAFSRNTSSGALTPSRTPKATGLSGALDVQVDSQNKFLFASYINAVEVMSIGADGSPTRISPVSTFSTNNNGQGSGPHAMAIHPNGQSLYTANINAHSLTVFKIDPATGVLTEVVPNPQTGADPNYVFIHPNGQILYSMDTAVSQVSKFTINGDGSLTAPEIIGSAIVGVGPNGIATTNN